jgi:DNA-binding LacI/PurR family transcriptional regulator
MNTTIHDVARLAGVGIGTVSRVINNHSAVKPGTREKVMAAIEQLHYKPDPIARSMVSRRTNAIGIIVPFFTRPFFMEVLQGVENTTARLGKELVLYNVQTNEQRDHFFSEMPMHRRVDGVLILSLSPDDEVAHGFGKVGLPVVLVDAYSPFLPSLVVNNIDGAYQAMMRLIQKGHRHIGFINGIVEGNFKFNQATDRLIGVHRALAEAGLSFEPELMLETEWNRQSGREAALRLLSQKQRPTAIFAASDIQAVGVLEAARNLHIAVPHELSVIGFDGIELSELLELSTVQQPMRQMGELGIMKLMQHIESDQKDAELICLNTKLVERATTANAPL